MKILVLLSCLSLFILVFRFISLKGVSPILGGAVGLYVLVWFAIPCVLSIVFTYDELSASQYYFGGVTESNFQATYLIETTLLCAILIGFILIRKKNSRRKWEKLDIRPNVKKAFFVLIIIVLIVNLFYGSGSYIDNNLASSYEAQRRGFIFNLAESIALASLVVLLVEAKHWSKELYLSVFLLCLWVVLDLLGGGRISFLLIPSVFVFRYLKNHVSIAPSLLIKAGVGIIFLIYVVIPVSYQLQEIRRSGAIAIDTFTPTSSEEPSISFLDLSQMLFWKFDSFSAGHVLYDSVKNGGLETVGIRPYIGSGLVFLPRAIWPERPIAGSYDGTISGHPSRYVPILLGVESDSFNVGVSPLSITLWQWGLMGYVIHFVCGVFYLWVINNFLTSSVFFKRVLGVYLMGMPALFTLFPSPDFVLKGLVICTFLIGASRLSTRLFSTIRRQIFPV